MTTDFGEMSDISSAATGLSVTPLARVLTQSPPVGGVERAQSAEALCPPRRLRGALGWSACLMLALGLHAAGAAALLAHWQNSSDDVASAPVILLELATIAAAPATPPTEIPPGPPQPQAEEEPQAQPGKPIEKAQLELTPAEPVEKVVALPPSLMPQPSPTLPPTPPTPPEKKVEKKKQPQHASLASAPSVAEKKTARAAAPVPGALTHSNALPNWKSALVAQLERNKRYPDAAHGDHGVTELAFSVDRSGRVHRTRIVRSSGSDVLDRASLELIARAAPLPPPPPEIAGAQIAVVVPVRYNSR